jgi:hypothetical protein
MFKIQGLKFRDQGRDKNPNRNPLLATLLSSLMPHFPFRRTKHEIASSVVTDGLYPGLYRYVILRPPLPFVTAGQRSRLLNGCCCKNTNC